MRVRLVRISAALLFAAVSLPVLAAPASAGPIQTPWSPWSQDYYDFDVPVITCVQCVANLTFTNYNVDPVELVASDPFAAFSNPSQLSVTGDTCNAGPVLNGGTCNVQVTFTREVPQGPITDQLQANFMDTVTTNPVTTPPVALFAGGASYVATTLSGTVNFGNVPDGNSTMSITYNLFNWNLIIHDIPPSILQPFTLVGNNCSSPTAVAGATNEGTCTMQVEFSPTTLGEQTEAFDASFSNSQTQAAVWTEPLELVGVGTQPTNGQVPEAPFAVLLPGLGLVALAGVGLVRRRRSLSAG